MTNIRIVKSVRFVAAIATFFCAAIDLLYGPSRLEYPAPLYLTHLSSVADSLILASTFYCALGLLYGRRVAWHVSAIILSVAVVWYSIESSNLVSPLSLIPLSVLCLLLVTKRYYRIPVARSLETSDIIRTVGVIIAISGVAIGVRFILAALEHSPLHPLNLLITTLEHMYNLSSAFEPSMKRHYISSLFLAGIGALNYCLLTYALLRPITDYYQHSPQAERRVLELLEAYGNSSEDYFKFFPHDKSYFFDERGEGFIAYAVTKGICVALADPIAKDSRTRQRLLNEFHTHCQGIGWPLVFLGVTHPSKDLYEKEKLSIVKIGESAVVDLQARSASKPSKNMRNIMNRFHAHQYRIRFLNTVPESVMTQLEAVSNAWVAHRGRREHQFAMGYFDKDYLRHCRVAAAVDESNTIKAFVNLQPNYSQTKRASIDMIRVANDALPNTMDFLLYSLMERLAREGWREFDLGLAPLSGLDTSTQLSERSLNAVYRAANRWFSFRGLRRFKQKFHPTWEPIYVAYDGSVSMLAQIAQAINELMQYRK